MKWFDVTGKRAALCVDLFTLCAALCVEVSAEVSFIDIGSRCAAQRLRYWCKCCLVGEVSQLEIWSPSFCKGDVV